MATPSVKFLSYNSTGLNAGKVQWINELMSTCAINFCGIQEHFKRTRSISNFFKTAFPSFDAYVEPGYRDEGRDTGRAQGGLAQLSSKDLQVRKGKVTSTSWRVQAQILHFGSYKLLWMNVYFPTDPRVLNFDDGELLLVQHCVEDILDAGGYDDCLCAGDWNYDQRRKTGFAASMQGFLERVGLVSVWENFPIDFTHLHTDDKSTSILDNFYVNERLLQYVESAAPLHLGDNLSRHSPIMLVLRIEEIPRSSYSEELVRRPRRLAWDTASQSQVNEYQAKLQEGLARLEVPNSIPCCDVMCTDASHSMARDGFVLDIMSTVIEASYSSISPTPAPRKGSKLHFKLPGWNVEVKPLKEDSKFWYSIWLSAGRPSTGALHSVMVNAKAK